MANQDIKQVSGCPILINYEIGRPIGTCHFVDNVLRVKINADFNLFYQDMANLFGGAGYRVTKHDVCPKTGRALIREAEILCFSLDSRLKAMEDDLLCGRGHASPKGIMDDH